MARTKRLLRKMARAMCEEEVTETFTHRVTLGDGTVLRADPAEAFWYDNRFGSWYGEPPKEWDAAKAVEEAFQRRYVEEADYS